MTNSNGYFLKMLTFILIAAAPVGFVAVWLLNSDKIDVDSLILLVAAAAVPAYFLYSRLVKEILGVSKQMEKAVDSPALEVEDVGNVRDGFLPVNDLLLMMQQYRRALRRMLVEAKSRQDDATMLFEMLPDPILVLDEKRRVTQANAAAHVFFGSEKIEGDLTSFLRHPNLLKAVDAAYKGQGDSDRVEFRMSDVVTRHVAAYVVSLEGEEDQDKRLILTLHDLTASKKMAQMRVDFVANASHELRTPLAILVGALETLMGPARDDKQAHERFFNMMQAQSSRMSQLIDDLLSLSQIEINEHSRPSETVNLADVVQGATSLIRSRASDLGKTITIDLPEEPAVIAGDADQLSQVFTNLIDNGLKYSKPNSEIRVSISADEKEARVAVQDQGEGIDESHLPRLTERFYRVDSDRSRELGGTGLGLAIVKHIVSRHRGQLDIESVVGEGSTFTVKLPISS